MDAKLATLGLVAVHGYGGEKRLRKTDGLAKTGMKGATEGGSQVELLAMGQWWSTEVHI